MSFLPNFSKPKPQRLYENILAFRTLTTIIRTWVEREPAGPSDVDDYLVIKDYVDGHRSLIDSQPLLATAEMLTEEFPRICAIEVLNGSKTNGVLIYPRWA